MPRTQSLPCLAHPSEKRRMMLEAILEPVVLVLEADQNARGFPVPCDDDLALGSKAQKA